MLAHGLQARRLHDPIEWLLSHAPAAWGNISYAQYILQFIVYSLWPREFLTSWLGFDNPTPNPNPTSPLAPNP